MSSGKLAVIHIIVLPCNVYFFLWLLPRFSFYSVFSSWLWRTWMLFFEIILLVVHWAFWICKLLSLTNFGGNFQSFLQIFFSALFSFSFPFGTPVTCMLSFFSPCLYLIPCSFVFNLFFFSLLHWIIPFSLFSSSQTLFWCLHLVFKPSCYFLRLLVFCFCFFYIFHTVFFIPRISTWFFSYSLYLWNFPLMHTFNLEHILL